MRSYRFSYFFDRHTVLAAAVIIIVLIVITTWRKVRHRHHSSAKIENALSIETFNDTLYSPAYASGFVVLGAEGRESLLLKVSDPWQGAENATSSLLLLRGGETAPADFNGAVIDSVARRLIAMSTTNVAMLDEIDRLDNVVGVSGLRFLTSEHIDRQKTVDVGNEADADYEAIVAARPDLTLIYGIATPSVMEPKLKQLNIPYLYIADYLEESPLGRAEWIVPLGYITGNERAAIDIFNTTADRYNELKASVDTSAGRPVVMLNAPYNDTWFMPDASSYMATLIKDAGGRYVYDKNTTGKSVAAGDEEALLLASKSDLWLCPGSFSSISALTASLPRYSNIPSVKNRRVWNNTLRTNAAGGNDFYESGAIHPDRILEDLIEIINPTDHDYQPYYFVNLK